MDILTVSHLTKTYGEGETATRALDDVSLTVAEGEFVAIVGSSGSGKSTLLHLIGGVDRPTSGHVMVNGIDVYGRSRLGLRGREGHLPSQLSGGQQQRVAIGRALMTAPSVVLADEPTGNLDSKNSAEIMQLLRDSNREMGQTMLVITHSEEIALAADRIVAIEDGRIVRDERIRR